MSDLQDTLDAIDQLAVHECGHCRRSLSADSESPDFCSPGCQSAWLAAKQEIIELVGYQEPDDLPVYVDNLEELRSPETTPASPDWLPESRWWDVELQTGMVGYRLEFDTTPITAAFERLAEQARVIQASWERSVAGLSPAWVIYDEIRPFGVVLNSLRVTAPEPEIVVVEPDEPPFGSDFDFEQTPAKSLPHEPPPAVMPAVPAQDWQALIGSQSGRYQAPDRFRRPFGRSHR